MRDEFLEFMVFFFLGGILGGLLVGAMARKSWRSDAIERGFARYHETTGKWEWRTNFYGIVIEGPWNTNWTTNIYFGPSRTNVMYRSEHDLVYTN